MTPEEITELHALWDRYETEWREHLDRIAAAAPADPAPSLIERMRRLMQAGTGDQEAA